MERLESQLRGLLEHLPGGLTTVALSAAGLLLVGFLWGRIFARAGHHPAMGFLMLIPLVNVVMFLSLVFGRWPIEKELRQSRRMLRESADRLRDSADDLRRAA